MQTTISIHEDIPTREQIETVVHPTDTRPILISGSQGFVDHVSALCLSLGVHSDRLVFEALYPTGKMTKDLHDMFDPDVHPFFPADESRAMKELPELGELFYMVVKQTTNHVVITDYNGVILFANEAAERITGYSLKEMYYQTPRLWGGLMSPAFYKIVWDKKSAGKSVVYEILNRRKDGSLYVALAHIAPILREDKIIAYVATEEDITEFKRLDKAKTEFIFLASHQLLTPLSAISWNAEMLLDGDAGALSPQQQKCVVEIQQRNQRMVALINALLNVARFEMGTFSISPETVQLEVILHSVLDELEPSVQKNKLQVKHVCKKDLAAIHTDPNLLRIIFLNLLSNAVKYSLEGGEIRCSLTSTKEGIQIDVSDDGIGIPKAQQNKVFQKLFRADNAMRKDTHGTGLGLYIVKAIVNRLGGTIAFESEENRGTTFHVSLPLYL
ncbi:PAS domain S-box protein [Candidatus Uhrbacteria bacterium]|nr:PAS domain S-box protein [Candidatus Uhrbacteria bacterium]